MAMASTTNLIDKTPWYHLSFEEKAALVGALGGITFGYDLGVISGALLSLTEDFALNPSEEGLVVAMIAFGQIPGAIIGGQITDRFGRKFAIFSQNTLYLIGTLLSACANSLSVLLLGQFVVGVGVAFSVTSNISYVTEMVPAERTGALISLYELATTFGVLLAYLVFLALGTIDHAWRTMFLCGLMFPVLQSIAITHMPESPKWLHSIGDRVKCLESLKITYNENVVGDRNLSSSSCPLSEKSMKKLDELLLEEKTVLLELINNYKHHHNDLGSNSSPGYGTHSTYPQNKSRTDDNDVDDDDEFENIPLPIDDDDDDNDGEQEEAQMKNNIVNKEIQKQEVQNNEEFIFLHYFYKYVLNEKLYEMYRILLYHWRAPITIMMFIIFFTFFTGGINIRIYAPTIFELAGFGVQARGIMTVILGVMKVLSTGIAVMKIDDIGRRVFFLSGLSLMTFSCLLLCISTGILSSSSDDKPCKFCQILVVVGCIGYTVAYQLSFGPGGFILGRLGSTPPLYRSITCFLCFSSSSNDHSPTCCSISELFPPAVRGRLLGLQTLWGSICLAITSEMFPDLVASINLTGAFSFHLFFCLCAIIFIYIFLLETKHQSPEQSRQLLENSLFKKGSFVDIYCCPLPTQINPNNQDDDDVDEGGGKTKQKLKTTTRSFESTSGINTNQKKTNTLNPLSRKKKGNRFEMIEVSSSTAEMV